MHQGLIGADSKRHKVMLSEIKTGLKQHLKIRYCLLKTQVKPSILFCKVA